MAACWDAPPLLPWRDLAHPKPGPERQTDMAVRIMITTMIMTMTTMLRMGGPWWLWVKRPPMSNSCSTRRRGN